MSKVENESGMDIFCDDCELRLAKVDVLGEVKMAVDESGETASWGGREDCNVEKTRMFAAGSIGDTEDGESIDDVGATVLSSDIVALDGEDKHEVDVQANGEELELAEFANSLIPVERLS